LFVLRLRLLLVLLLLLLLMLLLRLLLLRLLQHHHLAVDSHLRYIAGHGHGLVVVKRMAA
jgi:hypothetical protein